LLVTSELDLDLREILSGGRVTKFFQKVEEKKLKFTHFKEFCHSSGLITLS